MYIHTGLGVTRVASLTTGSKLAGRGIISVAWCPVNQFVRDSCGWEGRGLDRNGRSVTHCAYFNVDLPVTATAMTLRTLPEIALFPVISNRPKFVILMNGHSTWEF